MVIRGNMGQLLAPGLAWVGFEWLKEHPEEYSQFLEVSSSSRAYEEDQIIAGLGLMRKKPENEPITYDNPIQGGSKRYVHDSYGLGVAFSRELLDDALYGVIQKVPGEMMKSCRQVVEQSGANVLNLGFPGGTTITADGATLFGTHSLLGGGTYSNLLSPMSDIGVTSIQDILTIYENMVNERGLKVRSTPRDLLIPPALQFIAAETLQSQFKPQTGNNEINAVQGRLIPAVYHFFTSNTMWIVKGEDADSHTAKFIWRVKPVTDTIDDFETKAVKHSIYSRWSAGATTWTGWAAGSN